MYDFSDDAPLGKSDPDKLGHAEFAKSIANCILSIKKIKGGVIAIRGPWGSGKSSVISMVLREFRSGNTRHPIVVQFNSWCYRSEDEIVAGFFQELYAGLKSNISGNGSDLESLAKLGARVVGITKIVASGLKVVAPSADALISSGQELLENAIAQEKSLDSLQKEVSSIIKGINRKILFVIDDIDRLSPDEAIAIFRVIKSVGRLDNVIYLLSYDRIATERAIEEKYPSEGNRYLEKIVQAGFDLPGPRASQLSNILMSRFDNIFNETVYDSSALDDIIQEYVIPEAKTPRGVHRLANGISVTFPSVQRDVHIEDFVLIETLRLFHPSVYQKIQGSKGILLEPSEYSDDEDSQPQDNAIEDIILGEESEVDRFRLSSLLHRLFPLLNDNPRSQNLLKQEKRVCSESHFDTYFRFAVSGDVISHEEFNEFVESAGDSDFVKKKLDRNSDDSYNENQIESLFNEIHNNIDSLCVEDIGPFIASLYSVADLIHTNPSISDSYSRSLSNRDRIVGLSISLMAKLKSTDGISDIISNICDNSPFDLLLKLYQRISQSYRGGVDGLEKQSVVWRSMEDADRKKFTDFILKGIEKYADDNLFPDFGDLYYFLYCWNSISHDNEKIKDTFKSILNRSDENVIAVAKGFNTSFPSVNGKMAVGYGRRLRYVSVVIDIKHLLTELFRITKSSSIGAKERDIVKRALEVLNEYDEKSPFRRYPERR